MERVSYHILDEAKLKSGRKKGLVIEAHPDDTALGEGIIERLSATEVSFTCVTLTDGGDRRIPGYTRETLVHARKEESKKSLDISGFGDVYHAGLPDGRLAVYTQEGARILNNILQNKQPDFIIVPHLQDPHKDHAAVGEIALDVAGKEIPIYCMDTPTRKSHDDTPLPISHMFALSRENVARRNDAYLTHQSQVTNLPPEEMRDVASVLRLPQERGIQFGLSQAGVLYHANPQTTDIFSEQKVLHFGSVQYGQVA